MTDQTMPGMTGVYLAQRILQIRPDIPIILCTGSSSIGNEQQAKAFGMKKFAMKPVAKKKIASRLRFVLEEKRDSQ